MNISEKIIGGAVPLVRVTIVQTSIVISRINREKEREREHPCIDSALHVLDNFTWVQHQLEAKR
jgi:hypothetical protein